MTHQTFFKKNKYNAHKQEYGGNMYHSRLEADHARTLDTLKKASVPAQRVVSWERQVKYSLDVNGKHIANWFPDFRVHFADGHTEIHEVKGMESDVYKIKVKLFSALYPKETLIIIKGRYSI